MKAEARSYTDFSAALHGRARGERLPINGTIELTHRCPLACAHCYNNLPVGDAEARRRELSTEELCRILDELADAGGLWLLFTGGEIFARKDFLAIYTHAKRRGFLITLFTNGTQLTAEIADHLAANRPFAIEITLYGRTRETYERLTGVPGSFDRCLRGIRLLQERKLPLKLKSVAVTLNQHEIRDMQRFAEEELGVPFKFDGMINARIDCSSAPLAVRLRPVDMVRFDVGEPNRRAEWAELVRGRSEPPAGKPETVYNCGGGISSFAIDPEGKLSICVLSKRDSYDLRTGSFAEGWRHFLRAVRSRTVSRPNKCSGCKIRELCSNCAATAELESGDAETPVDYFCEVAHLRSRAVGFEPPAHGDCAFCAGGAHHARALGDLAELQGEEPPRRRSLALAPVPAGAGCGSGGCGSCGSAETAL